MKRLTILLFASLFVAIGCTKTGSDSGSAITPPPPPPPQDTFTRYTIKSGEQSSSHNPFVPVNVTELKFVVKFDSTAIYSTQNPANQADVNKLYGFADNGKHHQQYSARIGWRYFENKLTLHGYVYNNSVRTIADLGEVTIGKEHHCAIIIEGNKYRFKMDTAQLLMSRTATTPTSMGYKLFPFFGGNEMAPHDIHIWIKP